MSDPIRDLAASLVLASSGDPNNAVVKQGVVTSVNADFTANVTIDSGLVNNVAFINVLPQVGWTVWLANLGAGRWLGLGKQGLAPGWYPIDRQVRGSTGAISFLSIPQGYVDLRLTIRLRGDNANIVDNVYMRINNISTGTYDDLQDGWNRFPVNEQNNNAAANQISLCICPGNTSPANSFGTGLFFFPEYSDSTKIKAGFGQGGFEDSSYGGVRNMHWNNRATTAISRIDLGSGSGYANWLTGSVAVLEGRIA